LAIKKIALDFGLRVGGVLGTAGHVPRAPTRPTRDILAIAADTLGVKLRNSAMPACERYIAPFLREPVEMRFRATGPTISAPAASPPRTGADATPFETGVPESALSFRAALKRRR
jgi:hypothetical protein